MNPYAIIAGLCAIIILSYVFHLISQKTRIPSVLMLIGLGMIIKFSLEGKYEVLVKSEALSILKVLGNVGLVMIVLEASLDLKLRKENQKVIWLSLLSAFLCLTMSLTAITSIIYFFPGINTNLHAALINATPLSIVSSAIVIPSINPLKGVKKEMLIYESTFSDILGIMFFFFLTQHDPSWNATEIGLEIFKNVGLTIIFSILFSYILVYLFQRIQTDIKMFLVIAALMLMFSIGELFHFSSLLLILVFGIMVNNSELFFRGKLKFFHDISKLKPMLKDFHTITIESSFVVRTFFFVLFGYFINLNGIKDWHVALMALSVLGAIYFIRFGVLKSIFRRGIVPQLWIAPRGLITILLYFVIPTNYRIEGVNTSLLLFVILGTSLFMTVSLVLYKGEKLRDALLPQINLKKDE